MRPHPPDLLPDVLLQIVKSMKVRRRAGRRSHLLGQPLLELIFAHFQQTAVGVVDDDEFLRVQQVMRNDQ